ncbi:MAG: tRNA (adenosine(37)-N6)-threonylcarbamoyltransferase complex dimerization subunit type 1 TsaB [Candidatus Omnitrophica bacterium]|nr:tRNA (adenosine(37)-N6)-threonylcarbamoyltransferase complex dimerization subunit type 1 TsaB [Candidatus Omnitrophota bacterium]
MLLSIETSGRQLGVAVLDGDRLISSYELLVDYPHAVELPGAVTRVLEAARTKLHQLEAIVVDRGPGSFTGLRIGLSFVKALAFPTKIPVVGMPSLEVLAAALPFAPGAICPILDAKQKNVYAALYRWEEGVLVRHGDYFLGPIDQWLGRIKEPAVFLGDGAGLYAERLRQHGQDATIAPQEFWLPRAATLGRLGYARWLKGEHDDARALVPLYLYPQDCQVRGPNRPTSVLPPAPQAV